jgi:hypothetical protein
MKELSEKNQKHLIDLQKLMEEANLTITNSGWRNGMLALCFGCEEDVEYEEEINAHDVLEGGEIHDRGKSKDAFIDADNSTPCAIVLELRAWAKSGATGSEAMIRAAIKIGEQQVKINSLERDLKYGGQR